MAQIEATAESFLEGQGISVDLHDIETELAKLWGTAAGQDGGPELETPPVTRIVLANLVAEVLDREAECLRPVLETVIERYPCRAIVVRGSGDTQRKITAEVSALCHLPAPGSPRSAPSVSCCKPVPAQSTSFPARCDRYSSLICRSCSGGRAIQGNTRRCSATSRTSRRD